MGIHKIVENVIHALRYRKAAPFLRDCDAFVDLGCGKYYRFIQKYCHKARACWGLDVAVLEGQKDNIVLKRHDITTKLPFEDRSIDQVTLLAVLEHIKDPVPVLRECYRILNPGGRLIVSTPSRSGIFVHEMLRSLGLVRDVEEGEHVDFCMSKDKLVEWAESLGFSVETAQTFEGGLNILVVAQRP